MRRDVALVCIPAGTRNHFALDLGLDRDDVVEALDAFGDAVERRIDLAEVGGRVFVNNVSLGIYAKIVQSPEYRDAKRETTAKLLPELLGPEAQPYGMTVHRPCRRGPRQRPADPGLEQPVRAHSDLRLRHARPARHRDPRRLGRRTTWRHGPVAADRRRGRRPVATLPRLHRVRLLGVDRRVRPAGRSGRSTARPMLLDPPLEFRSLPGALRVRIPTHAPGYSPAALAPLSKWWTLRALFRTVAGRCHADR